MPAFPKKLDLSYLVGCEITEVRHVPYNLLLILEPKNHINICGRWRLMNAENEIVDEGEEDKEDVIKDAYRVHQLLGHKLAECKIVNSELLVFNLESGWRIEIQSYSNHFDTCSISPDIML